MTRSGRLSLEEPEKTTVLASRAGRSRPAGKGGISTGGVAGRDFGGRGVPARERGAGVDADKFGEGDEAGMARGTGEEKRGVGADPAMIAAGAGVGAPVALMTTGSLSSGSDRGELDRENIETAAGVGADETIGSSSSM